jgi:hypothetical protein
VIRSVALVGLRPAGFNAIQARDRDRRNAAGASTPCPFASIRVTRPNRIDAHHAHGESIRAFFCE